MSIDRELLAVHFDGQVTTVRVRIGSPRLTEGSQWSCPVAIDGILSMAREVLAADAGTAEQLTQALARQILNYFIEGGGHFARSADGAPIELDEVFAE